MRTTYLPFAVARRAFKTSPVPALRCTSLSSSSSNSRESLASLSFAFSFSFPTVMNFEFGTGALALCCRLLRFDGGDPEAADVRERGGREASARLGLIIWKLAPIAVVVEVVDRALSYIDGAPSFELNDGGWEENTDMFGSAGCQKGFEAAGGRRGEPARRASVRGAGGVRV
ncbi:hypothetical protein CALVIDRAFT_540235 [Calocera viscosa TUFC12733]|uniref:Uncharacterized protein n=1 Tax=Calocera viscosa (strain TUFC12733) TaxID=1330018 RepID=A0A167J540_CALVF|nr:hypothetical protein CALVIDRAFT_540235 [Calocera viscosa TUFC12733]